jgi:hypothetical protein
MLNSMGSHLVPRTGLQSNGTWRCQCIFHQVRAACKIATSNVADCEPNIEDLNLILLCCYGKRMTSMAKAKTKKKFKAHIAEPPINAGYVKSQDNRPNATPSGVPNLTAVWAAIILSAAGLLTFFTGLNGQFLGDDQAQIVNNVYLQSLGNIGKFFSGSTFYNGQSALIGAYYRPVMVTVYALIYQIAHLNPFAYHVLQLGLSVFCAYMLFLVFRFFFNSFLSLCLALIFLVDPVNSQAVYAIASLQEPLFMAFGLTALWVTLKYGYKKLRFTILIGGLLLLSLLSKETGILFAVAILGYALIGSWRKWREILPLSLIIAVAVAIYAVFRLDAVGVAPNPHLAPIDELGLASRLQNVPAIILFYLTKIVLPFSLAHLYYWTHSGLSLRYFILPLFIDLLVLAAAVFVGRKLYYRHDHKRLFVLFSFFSLWFVAGLALTLQITPLDETVSETWLYFPLIGLLGAVGVMYEAFSSHFNLRWLVYGSLCVICLFAVRTAFRGLNWTNELTLAKHDVAISKEDYPSYDAIAQSFAQQNKPAQALPYSLHSVSIYATGTNLDTLGAIYMQQGKYASANKMFALGLSHGPLEALYENKAELALVYGSEQSSHAFLAESINQFPQDGKLWDDVAIWDDSHGDNADAKVAVTKAARYESVKPAYYDAIMAGELIDFQHSQLSQ